MNEHTAAFNVAQKFVTEPYALACALNKTGNIRNYKRRALAERNNAEHGRYRCEMIVRNDGLCLADNGDEAGFSNVRKA